MKVFLLHSDRDFTVTVLSSLADPDAIVYRQHVLADCLEHPEVIRQLYQLAVEALENERAVGGRSEQCPARW
jgi:hypothetical protein